MPYDRRFIEEEEILEKYLNEIRQTVFNLKRDLNLIEEEYQAIILKAADESKRKDYADLLRHALNRVLLKGGDEKIKLLENLILIQRNSPYFARIDLSTIGSQDTESYYIGKTAFSGEKMQIIDWRAPVSSIYYRYPFAPADCEYTVEPLSASDSQSTIRASLKLRRTFDIRNGKLIDLHDNNGVEQIQDNSLLLKKLESKMGGSLTSIIDTIQKEQYSIIQAPHFENLLVQGVAGSGKTTIALHRISYLLYNFPDKINQKNVIFLSGSEKLNTFLRKNLAEFEVFNIKVCTLEELISELLKKEKIRFGNIKFDLRMAGTTHPTNQMAELERYSHVENLRLKKKIIRVVTLFHKKIPLFDLKNFMDENESVPYLKYVKNLIEELQEVHKTALKNSRIDGTYKTVREQYYKSRQLILYLKKETKLFFPKTSIERFSANGLIDTKGRALLLSYLLMVKVGKIIPPDMDLVMVDEAQDLDTISLETIKTLSKRNRFNFFGDLNQSFDTKNNIGDWKEFQKLLNSKINFFDLSISYRSSKEIIEFSRNHLMESGITRYLPIPVGRSSSEILEINVDSWSHAVIKIHEIIRRGHKEKSAAVIVASSILNKLLKMVISRETLEISDPSGIKGMEFHTVFIINPQEIINEDEGNLKYYVSITRAINSLVIINIS